MKLYFDNNMRRIDKTEEEMVIYYSSYLHNSIEVNYYAAKLVDSVIKNGYGNELNIKNMLIECSDFDESSIEDTLNMLVESGLFFANSIEYRKQKFMYKMYEQESDFRLERVYIHLTYKCNLNCQYCYNKEKLNSMECMSIEEWKKVLEKLDKIGKPILTVTGGEAILYPFFNQFMDMAFKMGFYIELLTNGTLLDTLDLKTIEHINLFIISLDSLESAGTLRNNSEKYDILKNILYIKDLCEETYVRSVWTKQNENQVFALRDYLKKHGIKHMISQFIPSNLGELPYCPDLYSLSNIEGSDIEAISRCGACFRILAINPLGKIYPCQSLMEEEFLLSDIRYENWIEEVKKSDITRYFRFRCVDDIEECKECPVKTVCGGGCKAISYNLYGDLEHKLDYLCEFFARDSDWQIENILFEDNE